METIVAFVAFFSLVIAWVIAPDKERATVAVSSFTDGSK